MFSSVGIRLIVNITSPCYEPISTVLRFCYGRETILLLSRYFFRIRPQNRSRPGNSY